MPTEKNNEDSFMTSTGEDSASLSYDLRFVFHLAILECTTSDFVIDENITVFGYLSSGSTVSVNYENSVLHIEVAAPICIQLAHRGP